MTALLVVSYLLVIIISNFIVGEFGQIALVFTSWVLIPFDLVARDVLHEKWNGKYLFGKMALLILTGSVLSYGLNKDIEKIAVASFLAFGLAGLVDVFVYHVGKPLHRSVRMNFSNLFSSVTDSLIFTFVAFGSYNHNLVASQTLSKFLGGIVWTYLFCKILNWRNNESV